MVRKKDEYFIDDEILIITIDELRRTLDWLDNAYHRVKTKTLTFIGAGLAVLTFLYATGAESGDVFFPDEAYGRIFYLIGLGFVISSMIMLFVSMLPRRWEFTIDRGDLRDMNFEDKLHYLQYVKDNYLLAYETNLKTYEANHRILNLSFYPLVSGAIMLIVLKIFGAA